MKKKKRKRRKHGPYLTTAEAALYCRCNNASTVRSWLQRGLLRPDARVGIGGTWLFLRPTLDKFLRECMEKSLPPVTADGEIIH